MTLSPMDNIKALIVDANLLMRQELALAKAEASEKLDQVQTGFITIIAGMLTAFVALLVLVQALVVALANVMPASVASLLVGVVLAIIAFASVYFGSQKLKAKNLKPTRTMQSVKRNAQTVTGG